MADDPEPACEVVEAGGYRVETITHMLMSGRHLEPREETWVEPRASLSRAIGTATTLGARSIYGLTGGHGTLTWEEAADCFSRAIAPCVDEAEAAGIALMIENASHLYADSHIGHSLRDTATVAEMAGIGVLVDIFGCWAEAGLKETIERVIPRCSLIQVSDYVYGDRSLPGRAVPGDGAIPLKRILDWALSAGYTGAFDLELIGPRIADGRQPRSDAPGDREPERDPGIPWSLNERSGHTMSDLPACVLVVELTVDASVEAEFNEWYDTVHLPDLAKVPGVRTARRYATEGTMKIDRGAMGNEAARRYLTLYDLESPAALETDEWRAVPGFTESLVEHVTADVSVFGALEGV